MTVFRTRVLLWAYLVRIEKGRASSLGGNPKDCPEIVPKNTSTAACLAEAEGKTSKYAKNGQKNAEYAEYEK